MEPLRLQKWIADCGVMSRRAAEQAIEAGRVRVNAQVVTQLGTKIQPGVDRVEVDGRLIEPLATKITFAFNKPRRVMCTRADPEGRPTVMDYFKNHPELKPVGRLDFESEGLLLMSSDGDFHFKVTHPKYEVMKRYFVVLDRPLTPAALARLTSGVALEDGSGRFKTISPSKLEGASGYDIEISEGRNRFIRRMFETTDLQVLRLIRLSIGPISLGSLAAGKSRELTKAEFAWFVERFKTESS